MTVKTSIGSTKYQQLGKMRKTDRLRRRKRKERLPWTLLTLQVLALVAFVVTIVQTPDTPSRPSRALSEYPADMLLTEPYVSSPNKHYLILHFIGVLYMFAGLAIVCDDYFVIALEEIVDRYNITEDVAGATYVSFALSLENL